MRLGWCNSSQAAEYSRGGGAEGSVFVGEVVVHVVGFARSRPPNAFRAQNKIQRVFLGSGAWGHVLGILGVM